MGAPDENVDLTPSAPPAEEILNSGGNPSPLNPEFLNQVVKQFFASADGRKLLETTAQLLLRRAAVASEIRSGHQQLQEARVSEEAKLKVYAQLVAKQAAREAARVEVRQLHALIVDAVKEAVRSAVNNEVPLAVRDDPLMKRLLAENLDKVRLEVGKAAEKELAEICDEERYHRVNRAFLAALEKRAEVSIKSAEKKIESSLDGTHQSIQNSKVLSALAIGLSVLCLFRSRSRL